MTVLPPHHRPEARSEDRLKFVVFVEETYVFHRGALESWAGLALPLLVKYGFHFMIATCHWDAGTDVADPSAVCRHRVLDWFWPAGREDFTNLPTPLHPSGETNMQHELLDF